MGINDLFQEEDFQDENEELLSSVLHREQHLEAGRDARRKKKWAQYHQGNKEVKDF